MKVRNVGSNVCHSIENFAMEIVIERVLSMKVRTAGPNVNSSIENFAKEIGVGFACSN